MAFMNLNRVTLIGRLGKDVELRNTTGGSAVATFSMATEHSWKNRQTEQWEKETEWHNVVVWGKQAESCAQYISKGSIVCVEGRIKTRSYEDRQNIKRYTTEIVADTVMWSKSSGGASSGSNRGGEFDQQYQGGHSAPPDDDIPF